MALMVGCLPAISTSSHLAPSNTGVAISVEGRVVGRVFVSVPRIGGSPTSSPLVDQPHRAAQPRCVSSTWPTFIRDGTPSGLRITSTGVPSSMNGMSSSGRMREITPLLPWRPASLSPTEILRFWPT